MTLALLQIAAEAWHPSPHTSPHTSIVWITAAVVYAIIVGLCLVDIARHPKDLLLTRRRWLWALITIAIVPTGFALYLLFGRLSPADLLPAAPSHSEPARP